MSARRLARGGTSRTLTTTAGAADLLAGPCLELWAPADVPREHAAKAALRAWHAALSEWAREGGLSYWDARGKARTAAPWSIRFLEENGRAELAEWLRTGRGVRP